MEQQEIWILHGLPNSGKTTYAESVVKKQSHFKRVSRDDFRHMLDGYSMDNKLEDTITAMFNHSLESLLRSGYSVLIDNTNLKEKYIKELLRIRDVVDPEIKVRVVSFEDTDFETCLERNMRRKGTYKYVPSHAMGRMQNSLKNFPSTKAKKVIEKWDTEKKLFTPMNNDIALPRAIIVDIDGTLAHICDRSPYDYNEKVLDDMIDSVVRKTVYLYRNDGYKVIIFSGREDASKDLTERWLKKHSIDYDILQMRRAGDMRKDSIVKKELFDEHVYGKYYVELVLDDRKQVVDMWRKIGLKVYQVEDHNF